MTDPDIVQLGGLWWPASATRIYERYLRHRHDSNAAIKLCRQRRTAVQAGALTGVWALRLAGKFERVITAEPHPVNWRCLRLNVAHKPSIATFNAGFAETAGKALLCLNGKNPGGSKFLGEPHERATVEAELMTIDSLGLEDVDLIYLDVEGAEMAALRGAEMTIAKSRPVIGIESTGHGAKMRPEWRWDAGSMFGYMARLGYEEAHRIGKDVVFAPR